MPATTTGPGVHRRPAGAIARWLAGASGLGHLTTSVLVLGLGYTGRPALAAVPLSAAWLRLRLLPGPAPALRRLRLHLPGHSGRPTGTTSPTASAATGRAAASP